MMSRNILLTMAAGLEWSQSTPVIDMTHWRTGDETLQDMVAQQVETAAREFGFFYVDNHGIPADVAANAENAMREFFDLPPEVKHQIAADKSRALKTGRGYAGLHDEQLDVSHNGKPDLKEVLDLGLPLGDSTQTYLGPNPWPASMPQLQNATEPYLKAALSLGTELLSVVARSVGLPNNGFAGIFEEPLVVQRLMRYPAKNNINTTASEGLGCGAHYDFGGLTLLRQIDAPGLQVQHPAGRSVDSSHVHIDRAIYSTTQGTFFSDLHNTHSVDWTPVDAHSKLLVVTFGEAMQRLTNGKVQATRHRVVHSGASARHSMAVFVDPNPYKKVAPLPELVGTGPKYSARIAGHKTVLLATAVAMKQGNLFNNGKYLGFGLV
mmetsp:Transcript_72475/g.143681  ORF Transcript_72475/g.143681 Transcript_72475/m.143681 type:complete len:379 (-) Transcript_72475:35-1171(-)